jgi:L-ribulose-5-phosphate 3-epimerase UlaE
LALGELKLLLLDGGALFTDTLLGLLCLPAADGSKERLEVAEKVGFSDVEIPVEEAKELLLHEVDFGDAEAEVVVAADRGVTSPVLVLRR